MTPFQDACLHKIWMQHTKKGNSWNSAAIPKPYLDKMYGFAKNSKILNFKIL